MAARLASDFLYINIPWFDADAYLEQRSLKFYWSDWTGHPCHLTSTDLLNTLSGLGLGDVLNSGHVLVRDSGHPAVHPLDSPRDQHDYDPGVHPPKPVAEFDIPIYKYLLCIVALRPGADLRMALRRTESGTVLHSSGSFAGDVC